MVRPQHISASNKKTSSLHYFCGLLFLFPFFHFGKFRDAVLIGAPEKILALGQILGMDFIGEEVDYITQLVLIQIRRSIVLRQYAFQLRVLLLDGFIASSMTLPISSV